MTYADRVYNALNTRNSEEGSLDDLLYFAYMYGLEDGVREVCKAANKKFGEQQRRAQDCRYWKMASEVVGEGDPNADHGRGFVYHPDFSQSYTASVGSSIWNGD